MLRVVRVDELRQPQRARHARRPAAHDDDVRLHLRTLDAGEWLAEDDHFLGGAGACRSRQMFFAV